MPDEEQLALSRIREFKNPNEGWFERLTDAADAPLDKAGDLLFDNALGERFDGVVSKVISTLNDAAAWTVRTDAIYEAYEEAGFDVDRPSHIESVTIEAIQEVAKNLDIKYQAAATLEGLATGAVGVAGAPADLPLLIGLALRATNEYATYFGFDIEKEHEKCYVMSLLAVASAVTDDAKQESLKEITEVGRLLAEGGVVTDEQSRLSQDLVQKVAEALVIRLAKGKLAQVVPIVGAAIGGGYNYRFMREVCLTSEMLYTERWLMRKYGTAVVIR